jgi:hypothetical protein
MDRVRAALEIEHVGHALVPELVSYSLLRGVEAFRDGRFQQNEECFVIVCWRELISSLLLQKFIKLIGTLPCDRLTVPLQSFVPRLLQWGVCVHKNEIYVLVYASSQSA